MRAWSSVGPRDAVAQHKWDVHNEKDAYKKSVRERLYDDTMMMMMMMIEMRSWRKTHVLYCIVSRMMMMMMMMICEIVLWYE